MFTTFLRKLKLAVGQLNHSFLRQDQKSLLVLAPRTIKNNDESIHRYTALIINECFSEWNTIIRPEFGQEVIPFNENY